MSLSILTRCASAAGGRGAPFLCLLAALSLAACGGRHTTPPDAGADADEGSEEADATDADEPRPDADPDAGGDGEVDEEPEPSETTWLVQAPNHDPHFAVVPAPGGDALVLAEGLSMLRLDPIAAPVWWARLGYYSADMSLGADGSLFVAGRGILLEMDLDGGVVSQHGISPAISRLAALDDGSVIVAVAGLPELLVMRFSPTEGIIWRRRLQARGLTEITSRTGLAVSAEGTIFAAQGDEIVWPSSGRTVLIALDLDGEVLWAEALRGGLVRAAAATEEGGVVLAGRGDGMWVARLDRDGGVEWSVTVGDYDPGYQDGADRCYPLCDVEEAQGVAVGEAGQVMAVGYSSARRPRTGDIDAMAAWLDREGRLLRAVAVTSEPEAEHGIASGAAAVPGGGWLLAGNVGGGFSASLVASFDAGGGVGGRCEHLVELELEQRETPDFAVEPVELFVSAGGFEVVDPPELSPREVAPELERLCD